MCSAFRLIRLSRGRRSFQSNGRYLGNSLTVSLRRTARQLRAGVWYAREAAPQGRAARHVSRHRLTAAMAPGARVFAPYIGNEAHGHPVDGPEVHGHRGLWIVKQHYLSLSCRLKGSLAAAFKPPAESARL